MDRTKIIEAILKRAGETNHAQLLVYEETLKYFSDLNLVAFAIELGIDTDVIFFEEVES